MPGRATQDPHQPSEPNRERWWRRRWIAPATGVVGLLVGLALGAAGRNPGEVTTLTERRTATVTTTVTKRSKPATATVTTTQPSASAYLRGRGSGCDRNYTGCVPANVGDVECADLAGPVRVTGRDVHDLDEDGDGIACG
jgi:hypothetical protein